MKSGRVGPVCIAGSREHHVRAANLSAPIGVGCRGSGAATVGIGATLCPLQEVHDVYPMVGWFINRKQEGL